MRQIILGIITGIILLLFIVINNGQLHKQQKINELKNTIYCYFIDNSLLFHCFPIVIPLIIHCYFERFFAVFNVINAGYS
jgi:hypothetical protein